MIAENVHVLLHLDCVRSRRLAVEAVDFVKNRVLASLSSSVVECIVNTIDSSSMLEHKTRVGTIALFVPSEFKRRDAKTADFIDQRRETLMNCRIDRDQNSRVSKTRKRKRANKGRRF